MANIEKQTIFEMPVKEASDITIVFEGCWHHIITRVLSRKKEARHVFKIKKDEGFCWFECSSEIGEKILKLAEDFGKDKKELELFLNPLRVKEKPQKEFLSMWARFKNLFMRK